MTCLWGRINLPWLDILALNRQTTEDDFHFIRCSHAPTLHVSNQAPFRSTKFCILEYTGNAGILESRIPTSLVRR